MSGDPTLRAFAHQAILDAKTSTRNALQKYDDESMKVRETIAKLFGDVVLLSGGTIALSITYFGYLRSIPNKSILHPRYLVAAWVVLMFCIIASLLGVLISSFYASYARMGIYFGKVVEQNETMVQEMDNLNILGLESAEERRQEKDRLTAEARAKQKDRDEAMAKEALCRKLWITLGLGAVLAFPTGIGLLLYFAAKNM